MKSTILLAVVLVIIGVGSLLGSFLYRAYSARSNGYTTWQPSQYIASESQEYPTGYGNRCGYAGMMGQGTVSGGEAVMFGQAIQEMQNVPSYAKVSPSENTVVFDFLQLSIFVVALMPDRAVNLTGRRLPSYAIGDVFVIYGLINPALAIPAGASVQFTVVNLDMYDNQVRGFY